MAFADMETIDEFEEDGFAVFRDVLSARECARLVDALPSLNSAGSRNLLYVREARVVVEKLRTNAGVSALLPPKAVAVQCTYFAKGAHINWSVAPHQDLSIPVASRIASPECTGWARKEGVLFTQPPADVLANLVAVRLQLDPASAGAGPLHVIAGTHRLGRIKASAIAHAMAGGDLCMCLVPVGGVLAMRPLLIHWSGKSTAGDRRVLHFLFGPEQLPLGLQWATAV
jgi:ectoine hydroxylase-related dioxygenase (phytanoyl-CoA dioxygenase family)